MMYARLGGSSAFFAIVREAGKRTSSCYSGEECQLPLSNNLESWMADLKLTLLAAVVASGTETKIDSSIFNIATDAAVARSVQGTAITQVGSSRENQCGTRILPWFLNDLLPRDRYDSISRTEESAQRVEAVSNRVRAAATA